MPISISVIVCTHNPRPSYLRRVLDGLRQQSLGTDNWELLIVDNASQPPLGEDLFPSWHPNARRMVEPLLGKTNAVLRGIEESSGDLLVIVDDDNVLAHDYLENATALSGRWPILGTWGGSIDADYEVSPPEWFSQYESYISVRAIARDVWFNIDAPEMYGFIPYGAGLCVRRAVAQAYRRNVADHPVRRRLDRKGTSLVSSGDTDLVLTGCDLGLGTGLFTSLRLTHLIHAARLTERYMEQMLREMTYSLAILASVRGHPPNPDSLPRLAWGYWSALRRGSREYRFHRAARAGLRKALAEVRDWPNDTWGG